MNPKEIYNFDNPKFAELREPMRDVIRMYQNANRWFDTTQEYVYIKQGMIYLSEIIHRQAHEFPKRFDAFGDMLHENHLMAEYPGTDELDWRESLKSLDDVFELIMQIFDGINAALEKFRKATDTPDFRAMSLKTEELMLENSTEGKMFLELWFRWANDGGSKTSFDGWCKSRLNEEEKTE